MEETSEPYDINYILDVLYDYNFKLGGSMIDGQVTSRQPKGHHLHFPGLLQELQGQVQGGGREPGVPRGLGDATQR